MRATASAAPCSTPASGDVRGGLTGSQEGRFHEAGARITISNRDSTAHTVTSDDGSSFDTGDINPGSSTTITVNGAGRIAYHCSIHPFMHGTIVVRGAKAS